jgi:BMFP domain-containing protein YqiC
VNAQISCNGDALIICDDKNECHEVIDNSDALSARVLVSKSIAPRVYLVSNNWFRIAWPRQSVGEARKLIDLKKIEEIVESIAKGLPEGTDHIRGEIRDNVRIALESTFARMNLVTREEFDAQTLVLRRTREKLEELERTVAKMEESEIQT